MSRDSRNQYRRHAVIRRFEFHAGRIDRQIACNAAREDLDATLELLALLVEAMGPVTPEVEGKQLRVEALRFRVEAMKPPSFRFAPLRLVTP